MKRITLLLASLLLIPAVMAQISRVEPPFWWTGMKNPALQLMVYGQQISGAEVIADYPGVSLEAVTSVENPRYLFIDLRLDRHVKPGRVPLVFRKNGEIVATLEYPLLEREEHSAQREGFSACDVIYLLMPDRFANGDPGNDDIEGMKEGSDRNNPQGRHGGDIRGILNHLDYLAGMGFTALWTNPLLENDQPRTSYHGYAITDFYRVDPRFGTNEDYRTLGQKAKEKGIKLIMDMVLNHCGSEHWWMKDVPMKSWINFYPEYTPTNHRRTAQQDPYASRYDREYMTRGWFVPSMPDLNQQNPFLARYLIQNSIWWIEYAGLSGIRMDTYPYPDKDFMAEWCRSVLEEYPHFNIVGEEWSTNPVIVSYWQKGKKNHDGYRGNLPSLMDFPLQHALFRALTEDETFNTGLVALYEAMVNDAVYPDPGNLVIFADNHDMARFFMQVGQDTELMKLGMAYILTMRGIPQIMYGTEILMTHEEGDRHEFIRKDFPGGWPGDKVHAFTGRGLSKEALDFQQYMKTLLNWRKENEVIHHGNLTHFAPEKGVYVYFRYNNHQKIMVILNKNQEETLLDTSRFIEATGSCTSGRNVITGETLSLTGTLTLPAKTPLILELE